MIVVKKTKTGYVPSDKGDHILLTRFEYERLCSQKTLRYGHVYKLTPAFREDIKAYLKDRSIKANTLMQKYGVSRNTFRKYVSYVEDSVRKQRIFCYIEDGKAKVELLDIDFKTGDNPYRKKDNSRELRYYVEKKGFNVLEVSTKSEIEIGWRLSPFNLQYKSHPVECTYHAGKVFENAGNDLSLLNKEPNEAKKIARDKIKTAGKIIGYHFDGIDWPAFPNAFFYYLYYNGFKELMERDMSWMKKLSKYNAFTDIEYDPEDKAIINSQAKGVAVCLLLYERYSGFPDFTPEEFMEIYTQYFLCSS